MIWIWVLLFTPSHNDGSAVHQTLWAYEAYEQCAAQVRLVAEGLTTEHNVRAECIRVPFNPARLPTPKAKP